MYLHMSTSFEAGTKASQGPYRRRTVLLGLYAGPTLIEEVFQLCHRQVMDQTRLDLSNRC